MYICPQQVFFFFDHFSPIVITLLAETFHFIIDSTLKSTKYNLYFGPHQLILNFCLFPHFFQ